MKKLIVISLCAAIITGFTVHFYLKSLEKKLAVKTVPVVTVAERIPKDTEITQNMLALSDVPTEAVHSLAVFAADDAVGRIATTDLEKGEQILKTRLSDAEEKKENLSYFIPDGCRAISIRVDETVGVAGRITKDDLVDIVAMLPDMSTERGIASVMVSEGLRVLTTGSKTGGAEGGYGSITLAVPIEELLKINYAISEGRYNLVLHSVLDKEVYAPVKYVR